MQNTPNKEPNMTDAWHTPGYGVKQASDERFTAWCEYADGKRVWMTGTGPQVLSFMVTGKRAGAARNGYRRAA